jgi:exodeoxyribonuclease VII large subunit
VPREPSEPTLWDDPSEATWSVAELGEAIGLALRRAFPDEVWVRGEIHNLQRGRAGMVWFDLVEPDGGRLLTRSAKARLAVVLFDMARRRVNARLVDAGGGVRMDDGTEVRIRARVGWWAPGGRLQLQMTDVDPAFTLGRLAAERDRMLRLLAAEGLLDRQAALTRPVVPLRIGLVTSAGSAAEHDVVDELRRSGIGFRVVRADARVQGPTAARSVCRALGTLAARDVDVVLVVRGGGATTDLAAFDSEQIARAIATLDVPVFTGIGHDIDRTVADEVAYAAYKTPTACAQAVVADVRAVDRRVVDAWAAIEGAALRQLRADIERLRGCGRHVAVVTRNGLAAADRDLSERGRRVRRSAAGALVRSGTTLERSVGRVEAGARGHLRGHDHELAVAAQQLSQRGPRVLAGAGRRLAHLEGQVRSLDPARTLARGWSITRDRDGRVVRAADQVAPGDPLVTTVANGEIQSTVSDATDEPTNDPPDDPSRSTTP